jgi:hypothetical protein
VNGPIDALLVPLAAVIVTGSGVRPTSFAVGVPLNAPVARLKWVHGGCPSMAKAMTPPPCKTVGWKLYSVPTVTLLGGAPASTMAGEGVSVVDPLPVAPGGTFPVTCKPGQPTKSTAIPVRTALRIGGSLRQVILIGHTEAVGIVTGRFGTIRYSSKAA